MNSNSERPSKACLKCGYILDGLAENRCPECGHPFNPVDSSTFDTPSLARIRASSGAGLRVRLYLALCLLCCGLITTLSKPQSLEDHMIRSLAFSLGLYCSFVPVWHRSKLEPAERIFSFVLFLLLLVLT